MELGDDIVIDMYHLKAVIVSKALSKGNAVVSREML